MGISFKTTAVPGAFPTIWRGECKMLPGGFNPGQDFPIGTQIHRGTLVHVDFATMKAYVCKTAKALDGSTTTAIKVAKGSLFAAGDYIAKVGGSANAVAITSVNTTNDDYDVINCAAVTGLAAGDVIVLSANGSQAAAYVPDAVVGATYVHDAKGINAFDVAYEAVVLYPTIQPVPAEWLQGFSLKNNHQIKLIRQ